MLEFPPGPRRIVGFQLGKVQAGLSPDAWKPFDDVGPGTKEIRVKHKDGIYRAARSGEIEAVK